MSGAFDSLPFTVHMLLHMSIVAGLAPGIAALVAGGRFDPVRRAPAWFAAIPACLFEFAAVWGWHAPALHLAARHRPWIFALEQLTFFVVSLYLWLAILGGDRESRAARRGAGVLALVLTFAHMTMLGVLIAIAPRDLYGHCAMGCGGALADQRLGGVLMITLSAVVYLGATVRLAQALLEPRAAAARTGGRESRA